MLPPSVLELLRQQHGALGDHQLRSLPDIDVAARRRVHRHPEIERVTPRVVRHLAAPPGTEQQLALAVLDAGAHGLLWAGPAASHWGFSRERRLPAHVAIPRRTISSARLGVPHIIRGLAPADVTSHLGIPICRPERAVLWMARLWTNRFGHEIALERAGNTLDQAWRQGLIDGRAIHALAARAGGRGNSGIVVLRQLLDERPPDYRPTGSQLESRFEQLVSPRVAATLERQVTVDAETTIRVVDFRCTAWPLVVEINGEAFHSSLSDRAADDERYRRLLDLGLSVVVFWEYDIWHDGATVRAAMDHLLDHPDRTPTLHRPTPAPWHA